MNETFKVSVVVTDNGISYEDLISYEDIILFTEDSDEAFILADALKRLGQEILTMHRKLNNNRTINAK